jgi:neutral amino acid transport system ATP-binding protein
VAPVLEVRDVAGGYGDALVLNGVSLHVASHELVTVIGPNGAGKSTLLKAIVGLVPVRGGTITFEGEPISGLSPEAIVARGLSYVPQVDNVFPRLTVRENLELMVPRGLGREERGRRLDATLAHFDRLGERLALRAGLLSGGERQMLALARALVNAPRLVLLDEPTAAVAPVVVSQIFAKIAEIRATGTPILLVEQNARQALAMSDRGYILEGGRNALSGAASDLLESDEVGRLYLGGRRAPALDSDPPPASLRPPAPSQEAT